MDNYNWESFTRKIAIKATILELYNAWTIPQEIEKWFLSKAIFHKPSGIHVKSTENVQEGATYQWSWFLYDSTEEGKIIQANGTDIILFNFAGDCLVEVKLTQNEEHVIIKLTQSNIPTDNQSKRNIRIDCDLGWSFFLINLKSVYEGGIDLRNKDETLKGMLNN